MTDTILKAKNLKPLSSDLKANYYGYSYSTFIS